MNYIEIVVVMMRNKTDVVTKIYQAKMPKKGGINLKSELIKICEENNIPHTEKRIGHMLTDLTNHFVYCKCYKVDDIQHQVTIIMNSTGMKQV